MLHSIKVEESVLETEELIRSSKQMLERIDALLRKLHDEVRPEVPARLSTVTYKIAQ